MSHIKKLSFTTHDQNRQLRQKYECKLSSRKQKQISELIAPVETQADLLI